MKTQEIDTGNYIERGIQDSTKFGIKKENMSHILTILRDSLYSDKIGAVIREYSCNAVDANVEAGKGDTPIRVTLPTSFKETFKIRDFGSGLTHDEIFDVYASYGESTKRHSNDYIGMLGIGCKSAFAYGDNFIINSFKDGMKSVYNAYIDTSRCGRIAKIHEEKTSEPDGIEIEVAVKGDDIHDFKEKAYEIFQHYKVTPKIINPDSDYAEEYIEGRETMLSGNGWNFNTKSSASYNPMLIMGNVAYPIHKNLLGEISDDIEAILNDHLIVEVEIGEVEISANRESLQYTDHTKTAIISKLTQVAVELVDGILKKFGEAETMFAAKVLWSKTFELDGCFRSFRKLLNDKLFIDGKPINDPYFEVASDQGNVFFIKQGCKRSKFNEQHNSKINCSKEGFMLVVNDLGHRRGAMKRLLSLEMGDGHKIYLVGLLDKDEKYRKELTKEQYAELLKNASLYDGPIALLSELPEQDISQWQSYSSASSRSEARRRNNMRIVKLNMSRLGYDYDVKSDHWESVSVNLNKDGGVYLPIHKYMICGNDCNREIKPANYEGVFKALKNLGIKIPTVYGVKQAWLEKVVDNPNWTSFSDYVLSEVRELITPEVKDALSNYRAYKECSLDQNWFRLLGKIEVGLLDETSPVADLAYEARQLSPKHVIISDNANLQVKPDTLQDRFESALRYSNDLNEFDLEQFDTCKYDIDKTFKKVAKHYPMLAFINPTYGFDKEGLVLDYLNLVDSADEQGSLVEIVDKTSKVEIETVDWQQHLVSS